MLRNTAEIQKNKAVVIPVLREIDISEFRELKQDEYPRTLSPHFAEDPATLRNSLFIEVIFPDSPIANVIESAWEHGEDAYLPYVQDNQKKLKRVVGLTMVNRDVFQFFVN
jgi:hypothetical protein